MLKTGYLGIVVQILSKPAFKTFVFEDKMDKYCQFD